MLDRTGRLREMLALEGADSFLITRPENRYYMTGFTGTSGAVLLTESDIFLITDFRYDEQARVQSPHCKVVLATGGLQETLQRLEDNLKFRVLGCEGDYITYQQYSDLREKVRGPEIRPMNGVVERLRLVKDDREIATIAEAARLSDRAFENVLPMIGEGVSERDIALEIEFFMKKNGAGGLAFTQIVASGHRSAMPHGTATEKLLERGDLLTMDFGPSLSGYNSDITRTVAVGRKDEKMEEIYGIVLEAQLAGIKAVRAGARASGVDRAAREVIESRGFGENFGHSTGHGLGLQIHENPRISSQDCTELKKGMVITVEPGIYLSGWGGVRIEDTVVVEENGCRVLNSSVKERLLVCGR